MSAGAAYEFPAIRMWPFLPPARWLLTLASQEILDANDVPFVNRDKCAAFFVDYANCMNKGTSFCSGPKDKYYECQYVALQQRLEKR